MSELQLGLLILGVLAVAGVLGFNKLQEARARRDGAQHFGSVHRDALLGTDAALPTAVPTASPVAVPTVPGRSGTHSAGVAAAPGAGGAVAPGAAGAARIDPIWIEPPVDLAAGAAQQRAGNPAAPSTTIPAPLLDARIDFIAVLKVADPVPGAQVLVEIEKFPRGRNVDVDGFHDWASAWEALNRDAVYEKVRVGVQISDRAGPLRADELEAFQTHIGRLGATLGATVEWPGEPSPLERAVELDAFCAGVDVQIGINVVAASAVADTKLRGLAAANGFAREDDGVFRRRDDAGAEVLSMRQAAPAAVSFTLDVPRVPREAAALALMAQCAKRFAAGIDGKLVDDQGKPLNDAGIAAIHSSLAAIYGRMDAAAMPAGGTIARRVFS